MKPFWIIYFTFVHRESKPYRAIEQAKTKEEACAKVRKRFKDEIKITGMFEKDRDLSKENSWYTNGDYIGV